MYPPAYSDEAQTKMIALKERSDKDIAQQEMEMKELQRIIKHDDKLKEFMGIKVHDRADLREEEMAKKQRGKGERGEAKRNDHSTTSGFSLQGVKNNVFARTSAEHYSDTCIVS